MTIPVSKLMVQVRHTLVDVDKVYWTEDELVGWYNAALLAVIAARPDAHARQAIVNAKRGTLQDLPVDALRLIRVIRNESGSKRPITAIEMATIDRLRPDWHADATTQNAAEHYVYDQRDPRHFYLYPAVNAGVSVLLSYSYVPQPIATGDVATATMPIDDVYYNPVIDYMLFRGFSKDAAFVNNGRARNHLVAFNEALGIKMQADDAMSR